MGRHSAGRTPLPPAALGPVTDPRLLDLGDRADEEVDDAAAPPVGPRPARAVLDAELRAEEAWERGAGLRDVRRQDGAILLISCTALSAAVCLAVLLH